MSAGIQALRLRVGVVAILLGAAAVTASLPGCPETCGNISVPYPFGIGTGCFREGFNLTCSNSSDPPKLFLGDGTIEVLNISLPEGVVRINSNLLTFFANSDATPARWNGLMGNGPYTISAARNCFVAVGCNIFATIATQVADASDVVLNKYIGFCSSMCNDESDNYGVQGDVCSGISCCQIPINAAIKNFDVSITNLSITHLKTTLSDSAPAVMPSKAFVVEQNLYKFNWSDLNSSRQVWESKVIPTVLDWTIEDITVSCELPFPNQCNTKGSCARSKYLTSFACRSRNSQCYDYNNSMGNGAGYLCSCSQGYEGNPYLDDGCRGMYIDSFFVTPGHW